MATETKAEFGSMAHIKANGFTIFRVDRGDDHPEIRGRKYKRYTWNPGDQMAVVTLNRDKMFGVIGNAISREFMPPLDAFIMSETSTTDDEDKKKEITERITREWEEATA